MSDEVVEQITKDPLPEKKSTAKEKDPKKVAAGKKLAEYNKKAKEALAREMKREAETSPTRSGGIATGETTQVDEQGSSQAWIPELSFTTVLSLVGIGFTAVDMFMRYYKNRVVDLSQVPTHVPESFKEPPPSKIPIPQATKSTPKMGML